MEILLYISANDYWGVKMYRLNRFICVVLSCFLLLSSIGCGNKEALPLNDTISVLLVKNNIKKTKIIKIFSNKDIQEPHYYSVIVTDDELKKYVDNLLLSHEKMIEVTDRNTVQNGDAIVVSYVVRYNSEIVANTDSEPLMVGSGNYGEEFENAVIGAVVGEPFECELSSPIDTEKYKKGDALQYNITVESINYFEAYTSSDQYILDYYGAQTEEEFLSYCKQRLLESKKYESDHRSDTSFLERLAQKCEFYIDEDEVIAYSQNIVDAHKDLAYISGLELTEYIDVTLNMTEEEFYNQCYNDGLQEIKQYLLVGAYQKDVTFDNNKDFALFCSMNGYDSTVDENSTVKYEYLVRKTVLQFVSSKQNLAVKKVITPFERNQAFAVEAFDVSNTEIKNYLSGKKYTLDDEIVSNLLWLSNSEFSTCEYEPHNHLYDMVLAYKVENQDDILFYIDRANGYMKYQTPTSEIVYSELSSVIEKLGS